MHGHLPPMVTAASSVDSGAAYRTAFTDWLACACAGAGERAARAVRASGGGLLTDVAFAATAGHVLDFDDTFSAGVTHVSAPTAPAALVLACHLRLSLGTALDAYAHGYEAMAALAAASHPALYDAGWHPTTVCGPVGAVIASSRLLQLSEEQERSAVAIALLRAGGTRGAFGSDGKAIQVGLAAAAGVQAALLAQAGASVDQRVVHGPLGFLGVVGARWPRSGLTSERRSIDSTWIKLHPSCLGTHAPIEAAAELRDPGNAAEPREPGNAAEPRDRGNTAEPRARGAGAAQGPLSVLVNPLVRRAAHLDAVSDGLSGKFSIPYCVAFTLLHGPPRHRDFAVIDPAAARRAQSISVTVDQELPDWGAAIARDGHELVRVSSPPGAPERPLGADRLAAKVSELAGTGLLDALADLDVPAAVALRAAGLDHEAHADV